jgi:Protein of unknown function (DUF2924)
MNAVLRQEIESLRKLKTKALKARYQELFQEESTSSNHQHLFRRVAWRLQAQAEGDLSERARERARQLAEDVDLRLRAPRRFWKQLADGTNLNGARDSRIPAVGTVLKREHQGKMIEATVLEEGFDHNGRTYGSLSAIAHHATGTRWNGFTFFHL